VVSRPLVLVNRTIQKDIFHHTQPQTSLKIAGILAKSFLFMVLLLIQDVIINFSYMRMGIGKCTISLLPGKFPFYKLLIIDKI
jgi:hypothetical protein